MTARDFLNNASIIVGVMAIGFLIETAVPMFAARPRRNGRRGANLWFTATSLLSNWLLASVAAVAALSWRPRGLMATLEWPSWLAIAVGIVVLDFSIGYVSHRTMHMWPAMWRFHQIHHNDPFVDVTTTYRTHPVESVWRFLFGIVPIWILGIPAQAVVIQRLLQVTNGILEHANIRVWPPLDRVLSQVWVTPNIHKLHHSRAIGETNSNYANLTTLYDRLLGTYTPAARAQHVVYGLDGADPATLGSFPALLTMPFETADRRPHLTQKSGSRLAPAGNIGLVRVLIVEDERKLAEVLQAALQTERYDVVVAETGEEGFYRANAELFDLVLLDVMLPGRSGLEILQTLRQRHIDTPVLIITARDGVDDRVLGLDLGADDYLVKPFALPELLARVRALMRRGRPSELLRLKAADLELDLVARRVVRGERLVDVTTREFELLEYLLRHQGHLVSREMLARDVWKEPRRATPLDNVIDVQMTRLRKKVDLDGSPRLIHTVRGVGFVLREGEP